MSQAAPLRRFGVRAKLFTLLAGLVLGLQLITYVLVEVAVGRSVTAQLGHELDVGARVWDEAERSREDQLIAAATVLVADFGFRAAVASEDPATMQSALANHASRLTADGAVLADNTGAVQAVSTSGEAGAVAAAYAPLLEAARGDGAASGRVVGQGRVYRVVALPVLAPQPIGWVAIGQALDARSLGEFRALTGLHASVLLASGDGVRVLASSFPGGGPGDALQQAAPGEPIDVNGQRYYARVHPLSTDAGGEAMLLIHASAEQALAPYRRLQLQVLGLTAVAALLALLVAGLVGQGVVSPLRGLASAARRIAAGRYAEPVLVDSKDELADLADAFNGMQRDLAEREGRIIHQAEHDGLTGLPNRRRAIAEVEHSIALAREGGGQCAIMLIDLDRFKEINDTLGHAFGDAVLVHAAERLRSVVRPSDVVARLGGDEFLALLDGLGAEDAERFARRLLAALVEPLAVGETQVALEVSIGVAVHPHHGEDADTLMRRADIAMYEAKASHSGMAIYTRGRDELHLRQLRLMSDLRHAADRGELSLCFQPKVDTRSGDVRHAEALLRWRHAELGPVGPDEFIPLAERSGAIHALTRFVLERAVSECRRWRDAGQPLSVAVNFSAMDLMDVELPARIEACLSAHGVPPGALIVEVTESALMRDINYAIRVLERLRALGVRLAIDDFGTGQSSLAQLKRLPVDELKIDKSFVLRLDQSPDDLVIVRSTIDLGHTMGLSVIAEGVESGESLRILGEMGCDMVQGYWFSRPLPPDDFLAWCQSHSRRAGEGAGASA